MLQIGYRTMRKWLNILLYVGLMMFGTAAEAQSYATNSVLKDGSIYKIGVVKDGVYRITFDELTTAGIDVNTLNLNKIKCLLERYTFSSNSMTDNELKSQAVGDFGSILAQIPIVRKKVSDELHSAASQKNFFLFLKKIFFCSS